MNQFTRLMLLAILLTTSLPVLAGRDVIIDSPSNFPFNYASRGYGVQTQTFGLTAATITIPLNFGSGAIAGRSVNINFNGTGAMTFPSTGDSFAPFQAPAGFSISPQSSISFVTGILAPDIIDPASYSTADRLSTSNGLGFNQFLFNNVCESTTRSCANPFSFDAVLVALDIDTFVLRFDYDNFNPTPATGTSARYAIGSNTASFAIPNNAKAGDSASGLDFCFHNGVESAFTTIAACRQVTSVTPIPEPETWMLVGLGSLLLLSALSRRVPRLEIAGKA